jgi:hypothetical protein
MMRQMARCINLHCMRREKDRQKFPFDSRLFRAYC